MITIANAANVTWDHIVVGTGMGGSVLGHALARAGQKVLFCEAGFTQFDGENTLTGDFAESFFQQNGVNKKNEKDILDRAGRVSEVIIDGSGRREAGILPFTGAGLGGSTALYGMALERLFPADFKPGLKYPLDAGSTLPEKWPVNYEEMAEYYEKAEELFRVRGTSDPLKRNQHFGYLSPPRINPDNEEIYEFLRQKGMHPYQLPLAFENVDECSYCTGFLCDRDCKNDSFRVCLKPAINDHGAEMLHRTRIIKLLGNKDRVTGIVAVRDNSQHILKAKNYILAAGALGTPRILFSSSGDNWPNGAANSSGMVGRNLMRHLVDLYLVSLKHPLKPSRALKQLAFNDFYCNSEKTFGTVQSFGVAPPLDLVIRDLGQDLAQKNRLLGLSFKVVKPVVKQHLRRLFARSLIFASITEDLPYEDNHVSIRSKGPDDQDSQLILKYRIHEHELKRIKEFRTLLRGIFSPYPVTFVEHASSNKTLAHACGTCRFGDDPDSSVLNKYNRTHDLDNLYIVDSSFFPSSGGTNPGLTIAANSLRVAEHLLARRYHS